MQWLNRWVSNTDHCHSEADIGTFFLPTFSAPGMVTLLCWEATALQQSPWKLKCEAKQEKNTAFSNMMGGAAREEYKAVGEKINVCVLTLEEVKLKPQSPCEFVLGKRVGQLQDNPGKNHSLFPTLLRFCRHDELHRLKWRKRTTHHWPVLICCWMLTHWQRGKYEMFLFATFYNIEGHVFIFLCYYIFFPHIPNALGPVVAKPSSGWEWKKSFLLLLIL